VAGGVQKADRREAVTVGEIVDSFFEISGNWSWLVEASSVTTSGLFK